MKSGVGSGASSHQSKDSLLLDLRLQGLPYPVPLRPLQIVIVDGKIPNSLACRDKDGIAQSWSE